ncbi:MAG: helix-turn-helix domain-containing protein [Candidatus Poseidoniales archaeon]|jgi:ArsR family transcriptional regulator|nr:helix-turn-helix domain-containing protein [Candidatus Poseidoniales archaeon]|tara:strand:+ start:10577 stop:11314 length:738 start_codon:yes stop_codon:yes gene_type:complete
MVDFDEAMDILENQARRHILKHLVKEPHYPLQLSELLEISQQAVMKHIKVLEKAGFVESQIVPSEKGGPPKKMYKVNQSFSLRLDLGPDLFRAEYRKMPSGGPMRLSNKLPTELDPLIDRLGTRRKLPMSDAMNILSDLDSALERIDDQRDAIIALHQQVMSKASKGVTENSESYEERIMAREMMTQPRRPLDLDVFSQNIRIQPADAHDIMENIRDRLMKDFVTNGNNFVSANKDTPLPWWLVR